MTTQEQKDLRAYCAMLLDKYGFHFSPDDPVIPALYVIYMHMKSNDQSNATLTSEIKIALSKINPRQFHFHYPGEAWKFQMAIVLRWTITGLLVLAFLWSGMWYWSNVNDLQEARAMVQSSRNLSKLLQRVKKSEDGIYFIDFTDNAGDSVRHFEEYQRLDKKTVRVYLGAESK